MKKNTCWEHDIFVIKVVIVSIFLVNCTFIWGFAMDQNENDFVQNTVMKILWEPEICKNGETIIPGIIDTPNGSMEIQWQIDESSNAVLISLEPSGSAELPLHAVLLWPVVLDNNRSILLKEFPKVINSQIPFSVTTIANVGSNELFDPLDASILPHRSPNHLNISHIIWGRQYEREGNEYTEGELAFSNSKRSILWKKQPNRASELLYIEAGCETTLFPLIDEEKGVTFLYEKRKMKINTTIWLEYLRYFAKTNTNELLAGYR